MHRELARPIRRLLAVSSVVVLTAACGSNNELGVESTAYPPATVETSTTEPDQQQYDDTGCSQDVLSSAAGEEVAFFDCDTTWAVLQPTSYSSDCTECESVWLYEWVETTWELRARCNQYVVLSEGNCLPLSGTLTNSTQLSVMEAFPPKDVRCAIWDANTWEENLAESGCTADH